MINQAGARLSFRSGVLGTHRLGVRRDPGDAYGGASTTALGCLSWILPLRPHTVCLFKITLFSPNDSPLYVPRSHHVCSSLPAKSFRTALPPPSPSPVNSSFLHNSLCFCPYFSLPVPHPHSVPSTPNHPHSPPGHHLLPPKQVTHSPTDVAFKSVSPSPYTPLSPAKSIFS